GTQVERSSYGTVDPQNLDIRDLVAGRERPGAGARDADGVAGIAAVVLVGDSKAAGEVDVVGARSTGDGHVLDGIHDDGEAALVGGAVDGRHIGQRLIDLEETVAGDIQCRQLVA